MQRKSNIELLRIIAFIMVVFIHVSPVGLTIPDGIVSHSLSWYYATFIRCLTNPAISLFLLISGYVAYFNKNDINVAKTLKKLILPLIMYLPLLLLLIISVYGFSLTTIKEFINMTITLEGAAHHLWYMVAYLFVVLISPILINGVKTYNKKQFSLFLLICYLLIGFTEIITIFTGKIILKGMFNNNILYFITMFLTGYCINKYDITIKKRTSFILSLLFTIINYFIFIYFNGVNDPLNYLTIANNFNIINILITIMIFLFFKELHITNKYINKLSKLTYGAYIIHVFFISLNQKFLPFLQHINENNYYIYDIAFVLSVVIFSLITEYVRGKIIKKYI